MNIKETIEWGNKKLIWISDSPFLDVRKIIQYILNVDEVFLITHNIDEISIKNVKKIKTLIQKRSKNIPIAYLFNNKTFFWRDFYVDKNVLIPRPETEELVRYAINLIKENQYKSVLDLWTGSGCIAITLKKEIKDLSVVAWDISKKALKIAKKNSLKHNVKINFYETNLMSCFKDKKFDLIIANLPYVEESYDHKSITHEPNLALFSWTIWLNHYKKLSKQVWKENCKRLLLEIADFQTEELKYIYNFSNKISFIKDINWKNRIASLFF